MLIAALALVFGVSAAVGVSLAVKHNAPSADTISIVVAAKDVPRGVLLAADQVKLLACQKDLVTPGALTRAEDAVGRVVLNPLVTDEPVLERKLGARNARSGLAALIPPGMRAFTILTPNVSSGVAGFILPGNKVDVLLTLNGDERSGGGVTTTLLQNVEILAVDTRLDAPNENRVDPKGLQSVTLLVNSEQAAKLDLGQNRGVLHLALRNPEDASPVNPAPATLSGLQFHQERSWSEQAKDVLAAWAKYREQNRPAERAPAAKEHAPARPLEIRTLRGKYTGVVQIGSLGQPDEDR